MILITVILLSSWSFVQGDYKCICNYNVEKNVLSQASANADVIGYMYEFDCKPEAGPSGDDAWLAVAFEHKVGYVQKDPQIQIQTCPGSIPDEDKLSPETTTTTSTVFTTTAAPETTITTISQTTDNSNSTTAFVTTEQPITSTQQPTDPTTEPTTELITEQTTESTTEASTEATTELTTEPTTEASTEPPTELTTEPATMVAITNTTPAETTVLASTTTTSPTSSSTPYYDTTTPEPITTTTTKITTHIPTTFSSASPLSSSTSRPTISSTSATYAPTATSVLQGHTELCPDNVIQHSHRTGSILNQYGDKCYEVVQSGISWSHADLNCRNQGGHLAHIANQQEQDFVYHFLVKIHSHTVWIGLHDRNHEEHFEWTSGDPVTYENWKPGRKDFYNHYSEDCVFMTPDNGQWDDVQCGGDTPLSELIQGISHAYICQYATEIPTTIGSVTVLGGHVSQGVSQGVLQGVISLCPNPVRQQAIKDQGILGQYNHNCYELIAHSSYPWNYAERICHSRGGHLAHIQNQQEQNYLQGFLQQHSPDHAVWIGLSDQQSEEHFLWSSHDAVVYTNWVPGHTSNFVSHHDEDCVVMIPYKGGQWDDIPCGHEGTSIFGGLQFYGEIHPLICQYNTVSGASLVG